MVGMFKEAIETEIAPFERSALIPATTELTRRYKFPQRGAALAQEPALRAAYLAVRAPATFAAVAHVFHEICARAASVEVASLLDLGSGPGTAAWAAVEAFAGLRRAALVEADAAWIEIGKRIAARSSQAVMRDAHWIHQDLYQAADLPVHDLVVISYALGELRDAAREPLLTKALQASNRFLVVIEPGTVRGFEVILAARSTLIQAGTSILSPCPHHRACPLAAAGDWCHFAQRVERSSLHRQLKSADLGYEDEKFSYIVIDKKLAIPTGGARIVRHPQKHSGHVKLTLCTANGIERPIVSRSDKGHYKAARGAAWGDLWQISSE